MKSSPAFGVILVLKGVLASSKGFWRHEGLPEEIPLLYFLRAGPRQCLLLQGYGKQLL